MKRLAAALALLSLFSLSCARGTITPDEWKALSRQEKGVIVQSLRGHESARDAKGGFGRLHPQSDDFYVAQIDARLAAGDTRSVTEIWEDLVQPRSEPAGRRGLPRT